jgi:hypothetical protein
VRVDGLMMPRQQHVEGSRVARSDPAQQPFV